MKQFVVFFILLIALFLCASEAKACSCLRDSPLIDSADVIFVGKVIKSEKNNTRWFIEVSDVVKGKVAKISELKTDKNADCTRSKFELNEIYIFFVDKSKKDYFEISYCSETDTSTNWNTRYKGLSFDFYRKRYKESGLDEEKIIELEGEFYKDLESFEEERQEFIKRIETGKLPEEN